MKWIFLWATGMMLMADGGAFAANSTFAKDGRCIYLAHDTHLIELDLEAGKARKVELPDTIKESPEGITRSREGALVLATEHTVWEFAPETGKARQLCKTSPNLSITDIDLKPATRRLLPHHR